jgi:tetratricopeptide (TPR) repeat protein
MIDRDAELRTMHDRRDAAAVVALLEAEPRSDIVSSAARAFYLADALRRLGRRPEALELLHDAAPAFDRGGNDLLSRRRLNLEGAICFDLGRIADAEVAWRTLLSNASASGDEEHVARANHNLGAIYTLHLRAEEAIASYERAMAAYRAFGNRRALAQCHMNLGLTYRELHFAPKADNHFLQAIRYAAADNSEDEVAGAEQERALLIYSEQRDARLARVTAQRALHRFEALQEEAGVGEALRIIGLIELGERDDAAARAHLRGACERARATGNRLLEAEVMEAIAALEDRANDTEGARDLRAHAQQIFSEIGAEEWGRRERDRVLALSVTSKSRNP